MPPKPRQEYENRLEVGPMTTEPDGGLDLRAWEVRESRSCIDPYPLATFGVTATEAVKAGVTCGDAVRFYRRAVGEPSWGAPFFVGVVSCPHPLRDKDWVQVICRGGLWLLKRRQVMGWEFKNGADGMGGVLAAWADRCGSELWDRVDIDVTEPVAFPKSIKIFKGYALDIFKIIRRFAAVYVRVYEDVEGVRVLEMRDELDPERVDRKKWDADMADTHEYRRTFGAPKRPPPEQRKYPTAEIYSKMEGSWRGFAVVGPQGGILGQAGGEVDLYMEVEGLKGSAKKLAARGYACIATPRRCGWIRLTHLEKSASTGPYRTPNDLLRIRDNARGTGGLYAVQRLHWAQARGKGNRWLPASVRLVLADRLHSPYIPAAMPGGPDATAQESSPYASGLSDRMRDVLEPPTPDGAGW